MGQVARGGSVILASGFDTALLGYVTPFNGSRLAVYSIDKVLTILMERDGMCRDDAMEFFNFNIAGTGIEGGPLFLVEP